MAESSVPTLWSGAPDSTSVNRQQRRRGRKLSDMMSYTAQVISENGYHMASLDEIAERMDLSKASIYHYFDGKEALVTATLESCASYVQQRLQEAAASDGTPTERLAQLIRTQVNLIAVEAVEVARLFVQPLDWPPAIAETVLQAQRDHGRIFRDVIHEGVVAGEFQVADERIARMALQGGMNLVPTWYSDKLGGKRGAVVVEDITSTLMRLVLPAAPPIQA